MPLVFWLEFGPHASEEVVAAAVIARRMKLALHLVHVCPDSRSPHSEEARAHATLVRGRLARKAEQVHGIVPTVEIHVEDGPAERSVAELARYLQAELIVVGRALDTQRLDLLAQHSNVPVLLLRDSAAFASWSERPLRIFAAVDGSPGTAPIVRLVRRFASVGDCSVTVAHLVADSLGRDVGRGREVEADGVLRNLLAQLGAGPSWRVFVDTNRGPRPERLLSLAEFAQADLMVIGSRVMSRLSRLWERSVSRAVLHAAPCSIACVPLARPGTTSGQAGFRP